MNKKIILQENFKDSSQVFYRAQDIHEIRKLSGRLAENNEYQVHYIAILIIDTYKDDSKNISVLPIAYYNYPQKVSRESILFNMPEASKKIEEILPVVKLHAEKLINQLNKLKKHKDIINREFRLNLVNNIHRHP